MPKTHPELSVVIPVYNESGNLSSFHPSLIKVLSSSSISGFEIIYVDDGSTDDTASDIKKMHSTTENVKLISFSRNFGKEAALSAGIMASEGSAVLMLDGDGQHPVELIPEFIKAWKNGYKVVIGLRTNNDDISLFKNFSSKIFHFLFNLSSKQQLVSGATDFRLIDKVVRDAFVELHESERITRGLIDWLGFERIYIDFKAKPRVSGHASYSNKKLIALAANSFASLSPKPLYVFGFLGVFITAAAFLLGIVVLIEQVFLNDPLHWGFTGTAELGILILFLVGIVLMSQGILSVYVSHINSLAKQRPLFIIDYQKSAGIKSK